MSIITRVPKETRKKAIKLAKERGFSLVKNCSLLEQWKKKKGSRLQLLTVSNKAYSGLFDITYSSTMLG